MLIGGAEIEGGQSADVRIAGGRIAEIGTLAPRSGERVVEAAGRLLLPGLHDHHIHLAALASSLASVRCGPPDVSDAGGLAKALRVAGTGWLRGTGYHESVAGLLDCASLDRIAPDRPVRIQHRSGRMWFLNSIALDLLLSGGSPPPGLERVNGRFTGRLFDEDAWLRAALGSRPPRLDAVGTMMAAYGVTGLTEISPSNGATMARHFAEEHHEGRLPQKLLLAGRPDLAPGDMASGMTLGPVKLHLHEAALPDLDEIIALVRQAHASGRAVAVHCATEVELVFALSALEAAGAVPGDRIEHASIAPDSAVAEMVKLGLGVVSQPHFITERGAAYRRDVEPRCLPLLYRLRAFLDRGVALAGGSDAPFGRPDPWASMAAAVSRRTGDGDVIGPNEALSPEQALDLYLADPRDLSRRRRIERGAPADLCLIDRSWARAREALGEVRVAATWVDGRQIHDAIDQPPGERGPGADTAA